MSKKKQALKLIKSIDWSELRNQKTTLLEVINEIELACNEGRIIGDADGTINNLNDILNLIDSLQDFAVDELNIDAIHIYDFELEDDREGDEYITDHSYDGFLEECATRIFDELQESDGFHDEEDIDEDFIEGIMADKVHEIKIKAELRKQILNDLQENPEAFKYENRNPIYDSNMREDYEGLVKNYIIMRWEKPL